MKVTWTNLSVTQRRLLRRLADDHIQEGPHGVEVGRLPSVLLMEAGALAQLGLVQRTEETAGRVWLRLTDAGRQVEDGGASD